MNVLDIGIILILIMGFIIGFKTGVMRELVSFIGIIIVFIISFELKGLIGNILCKYLPFFKFSGGIAGLPIINILIYQTIAFLLIFSILLGVYAIALKLSKFLQKIINMTIVLWLPSKILGGILGFIEYYIYAFIILLILCLPIFKIDINKSKVATYILKDTPVISNKLNGSLITDLKEIFNNTNIKESDYKEILEKYKIINKKD